MTLAIHDQGGLTEAEIKLAIEESAERREAALDTKLASHREEIKAELDKTTALVNTNNDRLIGMQGQISALAAENETQTELLKSVVQKGDEWHEADIRFRDDITNRIVKIEIDTAVLNTQVKKLRLVAAFMYGTTRTIRFCIDKFKEADFWKILFGLVLLYTLHAFAPALYELVEHLVK